MDGQQSAADHTLQEESELSELFDELRIAENDGKDWALNDHAAFSAWARDDSSAVLKLLLNRPNCIPQYNDLVITFNQIAGFANLKRSLQFIASQHPNLYACSLQIP